MIMYTNTCHFTKTKELLLANKINTVSHPSNITARWDNILLNSGRNWGRERGSRQKSTKGFPFPSLPTQSRRTHWALLQPQALYEAEYNYKHYLHPTLHSHARIDEPTARKMLRAPWRQARYKSRVSLNILIIIINTSKMGRTQSWRLKFQRVSETRFVRHNWFPQCLRCLDGRARCKWCLSHQLFILWWSSAFPPRGRDFCVLGNKARFDDSLLKIYFDLSISIGNNGWALQVYEENITKCIHQKLPPRMGGGGGGAALAQKPQNFCA